MYYVYIHLLKKNNYHNIKTYHNKSYHSEKTKSLNVTRVQEELKCKKCDCMFESKKYRKAEYVQRRVPSSNM